MAIELDKTSFVNVTIKAGSNNQFRQGGNGMKKQFLFVLLIIIMSTSCGDKMDIKNMNFYQKVDYIIEKMPLTWADYNQIFDNQLEALEPPDDPWKMSETRNIVLSDLFIGDVVIREKNVGTFTYIMFASNTCHSPEYFIEKYFKDKKPEYYTGDDVFYDYYTLDYPDWTLTLTFWDDGKTKCLRSLLFKDHLYGD